MPHLRVGITACLLLASLSACSLEQRRSSAKMRSITQQAARHGLADVAAAVPGIRVDLRYAAPDNVAGRPLYPRHMPCLLRASTAERLRQAQAALRAQGCGLLVWDAWRPPEAQEKLHAHAGGTGLFLSPHTGWSRHCGGVSVDATLVDAQGRPLPMPTAHDENQPHTTSHLPHPDAAIRRNVTLLHQAMRAAGLMPLPGEWWHFDDIDHLHNPAPVVWGRDLGIHLD